MAIVIALLVPQHQALAQQTPQPKEPTQLNQISPPEVVLSNLKSPEFFSGGKQSGTAKNQEDLLRPLEFNPSITRTFVWKMRVPLDQLQSPLKATYEVMSQAGKPNNPFKSVQLQNDSIEVISKDSASNTAIVQGTVQLLFVNLSEITNADTYNAKLSICLLRKDGGCM